jgi:hypothetical protein
MSDRPVYKITFDPLSPGQAWQTRFRKDGKRAKYGNPFPGQWVVFDRRTTPPCHAPRDILFRAETADLCDAWIEARRAEAPS